MPLGGAVLCVCVYRGVAGYVSRVRHIPSVMSLIRVRGGAYHKIVNPLPVSLCSPVFIPKLRTYVYIVYYGASIEVVTV